MVQFQEIDRFPGYRFGDDGSVWSRWRKGRGMVLGNNWRQLRPATSPMGGYRYVSLRIAPYKKTSQRINRLVLEAFRGPCPKGMECRHLNGDVADNRAENLAWGTHSENMQDQIRHGTRPDYTGEKSPVAKLTGEQVQIIRNLTEGGSSRKEIARVFGVSLSCVNLIVNRRSWKHIA